MTESALPVSQGLPDMPWLHRQEEALLAQQGHALLLQGASGLGQFALALRLAQAWLCEARAQGEPPARACGRCAGCHAIKVRAHPDLMVLLPETVMLELGWPLDAQAQSDIDAKKRKPSREIRIEAMRQMITFSQRTNSRGRGKAVLVYPAENMNHITANALLKTLEEPPGDTRFVLASDAAHRLLPTIRSRCHTWALHWPDSHAAAQWLQDHGVGQAQAEGFLQMAGGRPLDALELAHSGVTPQDWNALPQALAAGHAGILAGLPPTQAIRVLQKLCHDLLHMAVGAQPRYFSGQSLRKLWPAAEQRPTDARQADAAAIEKLSHWFQALGESARTSEHPFAPELMLAALVEQARNALHFRV